MANSVTINVRAKDQASSEIDKIKSRMQSLSTSQGFKDIVGGMAMGAGIATFNALKGAAAMALDGIVDFAAGSVRAAMEEEAGIARLDAALQANIAKWDGNRDAIEEVISARQKLAFSDDEQRDSLALLVARTKDVNEALDIQRQAMDLARLKGISLAEASKVLVMALAGQGRALKELGINVGDYADKTEVLAAVQKAAAGQAEAYAATWQGTFESLQITLGDLQEDIGRELLPVLVQLATVLRDDVVPGIRDASQAIGPAADAFGFVADSVRLTLDPMGAFRDRMDELNARVLDETTRKLAEGAGEWDTYAEAGAAARDAALRVKGAVEPLPGQLEDTADAARDAAKGFMSAKDAWQKLNDAISTQNEFENLPDKITVASAEVKTAQKELDKAIEEGNKVAIAAARIRLRDAQAELAGLRRRWAQLRVEMEKPVRVGRVGPGQNSSTHTPQAGGFMGTVSGATTMLVGEAGPETVAILRNPQEIAVGGSAAIGPPVQNVIRVELDGRVLAEVVDRELYQRLATASTSRRLS